MSNSSKKAYLYTTLVILLFSTVIPALAYAAPLANNGRDWQYVNGNSWGWNYSPQTQINSNNVDQLEIKWLFPLEGAGSAPAGLRSLNLIEGSTTPPIIRNGKVFVTTNYLRTYALNAVNGKEEWRHDYDVNLGEEIERLNIAFDNFLAVLGMGHLHGIRYWEEGNSLLLSGMLCDFYGIDVDSGENSFWVKDLCKDIPGNLYKYRQGTVSQTNIGTYDKGNQFIFVLPGAMHTLYYDGDFRHTTIGVDMDSHEIIWRIFSYPPHDVPTMDWALQECDVGFFMDIPCSEVEAAAPENLEWDWARPGETPDVYGGVTANWGEIIVDEDTGIVYTQTGNQGPFTYVGTTPGPRLYGSTIMAIDMDVGKRIWWMQPFPRDPYDYDCNWGGILADLPNIGKVYAKGCKEGFLNILDAETGEPIHRIDVIDEQYGWGQITRAGTLEPNEGGIKYHLNDPFNHYDMREMESPDDSRYCGSPCDVYPFWSNGLFGTDMSYDPETRTLFHYATAIQVKILDSPSPEEGGTASLTQGFAETNSTIVARDLATGEVKWTYYYDPSQQRSHLVVTPDLVFAGFTDGYVRFFDKNTGDLLSDVLIGSDMKVGATTGLDSDGNQKIFILVGQGSSALAAFSQGVTPGTLIAIGLSDRAAEEVRTTTVTSTTTARTTLTSTTTSVSTSVSTSATTSTVTSSSTTTVTSEVTGETGLPAEITYAAVAVAVIAIVAAAFLMMRKR